MQLRQLMFVLPNLFTVSSIFCGFYALTLCAQSPSPQDLYHAAIAIFFGAFFDGFDGRVARLTRTQSDFGMELDSLADVISFGAAPSLLVYQWALQPLGFAGVFLSCTFLICGALRLARFNVLAHRSPHGGASQFFVGMPIPVGAMGIVSAVVAHYAMTQGPLAPQLRAPVGAAVVLIAFLMVSTVRYRTFKTVRPSPRTFLAFFAVLAVGSLVAIRFHPTFVIAFMFAGYTLLGLGESIAVLVKGFIERRAPDELDEDEDEDEEDAERIDEQEVL